jgi:hypothetical protein
VAGGRAKLLLFIVPFEKKSKKVELFLPMAGLAASLAGWQLVVRPPMLN